MCVSALDALVKADARRWRSARSSGSEPGAGASVSSSTSPIAVTSASTSSCASGSGLAGTHSTSDSSIQTTGVRSTLDALERLSEASDASSTPSDTIRRRRSPHSPQPDPIALQAVHWDSMQRSPRTWSVTRVLADGLFSAATSARTLPPATDVFIDWDEPAVPATATRHEHAAHLTDAVPGSSCSARTTRSMAPSPATALWPSSEPLAIRLSSHSVSVFILSSPGCSFVAETTSITAQWLMTAI
mmetsp:Transcript_49595/g.116945  ORF Transcript_49595/g.116945 Transcript_49595/m.116945 type:complete len:245 (-) Transcript_49595:920-1654(-)|eukprot:2930662-Rhodomonas_salina.3